MSDEKVILHERGSAMRGVHGCGSARVVHRPSASRSIVTAIFEDEEGDVVYSTEFAAKVGADREVTIDAEMLLLVLEETHAAGCGVGTREGAATVRRALRRLLNVKGESLNGDYEVGGNPWL